MTYKVTLSVGYTDIEFRFNDRIKAMDFAEMASKHALKCLNSNGESYELQTYIEIETCAEGGNPETAHMENHVQSNTELGDCQ